MILCVHSYGIEKKNYNKNYNFVYYNCLQEIIWQATEWEKKTVRGVGLGEEGLKGTSCANKTKKKD